MSEPSTPLKALESASQQHETETVIELWADRVLHFISVRFVIILAIVAKITEVLNGNLSCHPAKNETGFDKHFIKFANAYCWESPDIDVGYKEPQSYNRKECDIKTQNGGERLLKHAEAAMNVLRWTPYALLFEAFLFALPSAWWHFRVGGRLMGHLKFIQLLIARICDDLKDLPAGFVPEQPYDSKSVHLDGWCRKPEDMSVKAVKKTLDENDERVTKFVDETLKVVRGSSLNECIDGNDQSIATSSHAPSGDHNEILEKETSEEKIKSRGKILDRHLFSNLCYENFSSIENFPYLLSIIRLTYCAKFEDQEGVFPLNQGILRQWCHEKNFSGRFLVHQYYLKHALGIVIAVAMLRTIAFILELIGGDIWELDSFRCDVIYYEAKFVVCTLHRKTEMLAFILLNLLMVVLYLAISAYHIYFISHGRKRVSSLFFDHASDTGSVALLAALREKQKKKQKKKEKKGKSEAK